MFVRQISQRAESGHPWSFPFEADSIVGAPPELVHERVGEDLAAATDLLVHHLKRDRIPAVVRRPIPALDGVSLLDLVGRGDTGAVLATCRDMFRFDRAQS